MHLVIVHKSTGSGESGSDSLLRLAFSGGLVTDVVIGGISECYGLEKSNLSFALPEEWKKAGRNTGPRIRFYNGQVSVPGVDWSPQNKWYVISDGRFFTRTDMKLLFERVDLIGSDIVAVSISMRLRGGSEKVLTDSNQNLVGFRLLYADSVQPARVHITGRITFLSAPMSLSAFLAIVFCPLTLTSF